jgi:hypothetical protein
MWSLTYHPYRWFCNEKYKYESLQQEHKKLRTDYFQNYQNTNTNARVSTKSFSWNKKDKNMNNSTLTMSMLQNNKIAWLWYVHHAMKFLKTIFICYNNSFYIKSVRQFYFEVCNLVVLGNLENAISTLGEGKAMRKFLRNHWTLTYKSIGCLSLTANSHII